jgi:hypothetical protein
LAGYIGVGGVRLEAGAYDLKLFCQEKLVWHKDLTIKSTGSEFLDINL